MNKTAFGAIGLIAAANFATAAVAADLPARTYTKAPPPVVATYNWSGCYVGGNGGGLWSRNNWSLPDMGGLPVSSHDVDSWLAGVQVGCNYQFNGGWVVGIQGDYDWSDGTGSSPHATAPALTDQSHISGLGSVTGRVGYAWDRFLGYVKGGGAWERNSYLQFFPAAGATFATNTNTRDGWTVGIGGEYAFTNNLTGFVEYDYYDFGNDNLTFTTVLGTFPHISISERQSVVKAGLNWKFDWGAGPVVARY